MAPRKTDSNTKRFFASKYWCFTLNNYNSEDIEKIKLECKPDILYSIGEEIAPTTGTPHLQGFISSPTKIRPTEKFSNKSIHWEKCKSRLSNNLIYTQKEGKSHSNFPKPLQLISSFYAWQQEVINLIDSSPDDRTIHWFWEDNGCAGKTAIAKFICASYNAIVVSGKSTDCKNAILQYNLRNNKFPDIVIFDIPRCNNNHISFEALESIKNGLFYSGKYEGGMCIFNSPHVICFSNEEPPLDILSKDRWHVVNIAV